MISDSHTGRSRVFAAANCGGRGWIATSQCAGQNPVQEMLDGSTGKVA
jgi:hypothetical protein